MRQSFGVLLTAAVVLGFPFGAQAQNGSSVLVLEVYSVRVTSDVIQEKAFSMWLKGLKTGDETGPKQNPVIHVVHALGEGFEINKHYKSGEGSEEEIEVLGRVEPSKQSGEYDVAFSELGRPPAYEGKTALRIGPAERRVMRLPAVEVGVGEKLETVVVLEYKVEAKEDGVRSKFEI